MTEIVPLGDRVLLKAMPSEELTKAGIVIPESAKDPSNKATVVAVGEGFRNLDGTITAIRLTPGDIVMFQPQAAERFEANGKSMLLVRAEFIWCTFREAKDN